MTILISGVAGFIGSNLLGYLLEQNHTVIGIDNLATGNILNIQKYFDNKNFILYQNDILDEQNINKIFEKNSVEIIVHFAALPRVCYSFQEPIKSANVNIVGTLLMLKYAEHYKVKRFIFASSASIYGDHSLDNLHESVHPIPSSPYGIQKLTGESFCKFYFQFYGLETICLRYFNVFGGYYLPKNIGQICLIPRLIRALSYNEEIVINNSGKQIRDFTYIGDIISATILAIYSSNPSILGESINIGKGHGCAVNELVDLVADIVNVKPIIIKHVQCSYREPFKVVANNSKAKALLNWEPRFLLMDGLKETFKFYNSVQLQH